MPGGELVALPGRSKPGIDGSRHLVCRSGRFPSKRAFPHGQDAPTFGDELISISLVASLIGLELFGPKLMLTLRHGRSIASMRMPVTAMHENHCTVPLENNVGATGKTSVMKSVTQANVVQRSPQQELGAGVPPMAAMIFDRVSLSTESIKLVL
jgi:hypothetical protein